MLGEARVQANFSDTFYSRAGHEGRPGLPDQQPSNTGSPPSPKKMKYPTPQKHMFRTGKHESCCLTRISVMSIRESEMQSIMLFDYRCFGHTTSFLRATVKKQNYVTCTSLSGETFP